METLSALEFAPSPEIERETALSVAVEGLRSTYATLWDPSTPRIVRNCLSSQILPQQTHQVRMNQEQEKELSTDPLTGLYNKRVFEDQFERVIEQTWRNNTRYQTASSVALYMIDLDKFKELNDKYGHAEGDNALIGTANAINDSIRRSDIGARLGGDEFAVVIGAIEEADAKEKAEEIVKAIQQMPLDVETNDRVGASVGLLMIDFQTITKLYSMGPEDRKAELKALLHQADQQMYAIKAERKSAR